MTRTLTHASLTLAHILTLTLLFAEVAPASCLHLYWTAPGDPSHADRATAYDIRYSKDSITADNWHTANKINYPPSPASAGNPQSVQIAGLAPGEQYFFAARAADEYGRWSAMSNVASGIAPFQGCSGSSGNVTCDPDGRVDIEDLVFLIDHLFITLKPICCEFAGNVDGDPFDKVDISDLAELIRILMIDFELPPPCP